ncbi:hypothetical protein LTS15_010931 [Exophiala xenobiotica]|nr:hypothetical protein LTS15_010931 [Exophiala xenobiotica]
MAAVRLIQLKPTVGVDNEKWLKIISGFRSAEGGTAVVWALQHEDSKIAGIAACFDTYGHQKAWAASDAGHKVEDDISVLACGSIYEDVVLFPEDPLPTIKANVVELVSWIHPVDKIDAEREKKIADGFKHFQKAISSEAPEADGGLVAGWGQVPFDHEGVKSRRFTSLIGWKSVDAHYKCKETRPFLDNIHWLMENDDSGVEMVHYAYSKSLDGAGTNL